jgi:hypothetical protein
MTHLRKPATTRRSTPSQAEAGVALLISLFALMLICIVGVALIMASGTDTALTGNYRSATSVYYAALAGLEEGRGRLLAKAPNNSNLSVAVGLQPGVLPTLGQVWYITNPAPGETVSPWDLTSIYADNEYSQEFGTNPPTASPALQSTPSVSPQAGLQGPIYKWVRINAITATSAQTTGVMVNPNGPQDTPLLYANSHLYNDFVSGGVPAIEITALAAMPMPNGSLTQTMLQYVVAPMTLLNSTGMTFPAALTLDGNNVLFDGPTANPFFIQGQDLVPVPGINCPAGVPQTAIGYTSSLPGDQSFQNITTYVAPPNNSGIPPPDQANYTGAGGLLPSVGLVSVPPAWQTPSGLQTIAQAATQNADTQPIPSTPYVNNTANGSNLPNTMSVQNPMTIVVNGDLDLSSWSGTGYGILVVTGKLTLNSSATWNGVVLVIGTGQVDVTAGSGQINGAIVVAQALNPADPNRAALPSLGQSSWTQQGGGPGGTGSINYSSCWINTVQTPYTYKVLSFREVPLTAP